MIDSQAAPPSTNGRTALEVDNLYKSFGGIHAVNGAEFKVRDGSITALIGPNGAGKTTLFNVITGFYRPEAGMVRYRGDSIFGKPPYVIARRGMVRTFQITKALAAMPVIDNMMLAGPDQPGERLLGLMTQPGRARRREREVEERAYELLKTFNLEDKATQYAGTLSGGQRKLLELARALMTDPEMVLLDEPMAGINPTLGRRLLEHIEQLRAEKRCDVPVRRARHGCRNAALRRGHRHGGGPGHRPRHPRATIRTDRRSSMRIWGEVASEPSAAPAHAAEPVPRPSRSCTWTAWWPATPPRSTS